jgi:hypothetical protein
MDYSVFTDSCFLGMDIQNFLGIILNGGKVEVALIVKKFGGSSVATPEKIMAVAQRVLREKNQEDKIVIVVSALGDTIY